MCMLQAIIVNDKKPPDLYKYIFIAGNWVDSRTVCTANRDEYWLIGASLSEPQLAWLHCKTRVYVFWAIYWKFKLSERVSNLYMC